MLKFFKSKTAKIVGGLMIAFVLMLGVGKVANAALTSQQVDAILVLLNSFGADAATVANVQASLTGSSPVVSNPSTTVDFGSSTLKVGSKGQFVKNLQAFLGIQADGIFGNQTKASVKAWQANNNLTADGYFGTLSRAAANAGSGSVSTGDSTTGGDTVVATGPVSAVLSADNPASGTIVAGQATADLMHVTFTGNGTVNSVTLTRSGVSDQNTLSNVYLYDGVTRLTDGYSFNTNGALTMNNLGLVVNGSKTISVKADVLSTTSSYDIIVTLAGFTSGTSVNTVSIKGNDMFIAANGSLATIAYSGVNSVSTAATVNAGTSAYTVWRQAFQVNTRTLELKAANFRITGSAPSDALQNTGLYVDGIKVGNNATRTTTNGSNYMSFDMTSNPVSLNTGTHTFEVRGDIEKGSSYNFTVSLQQASDIMVTDPQVGVNVAITSFSASTAATISIGTGSFTAVQDPGFASSTNISAGSTNATIAKFKLHAYGEDIKVTSLPITPVMTFPTTTASGTPTVTIGSQTIAVASTTDFAVGNVITIAGSTAAVGTITSIASSTSMIVTITTAGVTPTSGGAIALQTSGLGLQNVTLYFNGSQVGTQTGWTSGNLTFSLGSQMIIPAGVDSTLEVRADLRTSSAGTNYTGGTIRADLVAATAEGWDSNASITTSGAATGNTLSIQNTNLALSSNPGYSNQNVAPNTAGVKIGSYVLQNQSTSEGVRVTTLKVNVAYGSATSSSNLSGLKTSETSGSASTPVQPATAAGGENADNTFSSDFTLAPGQTKTIDIFADSSSDSDATNATVITSLTVTSIGVMSNVSATSAATTGQTVIFAEGSLSTPTVTTSSSTTAQLIAAANGGSADGSKAVYNFSSTNGSTTISELTFTATNATYVKVGGVSAPVVAGTAYLTGLSIVVPNGGSGINTDVYISYPEVGTNGATSYVSSTITLTTVKSTSGSTTTTSTVSVAPPVMTLVGSKPAFAVADSSDTLSNSQIKIAEITVSADAKGDIKLGKLPISVTSTGVATIATFATTLTDLTIATTQTISTIASSSGFAVGDVLTITGEAQLATVNNIASSTSINVTFPSAPSAITGTSTDITLTTRANNIVVKDTSDTVVVTTNTGLAVSAGGTGANTIIFGANSAASYLIPAGTSKTFRIYATAATVAGAVNTTSLSTKLGATTSVEWYDVAGNSTTVRDAAKVFNYPTTTSVVTN